MIWIIAMAVVGAFAGLLVWCCAWVAKAHDATQAIIDADFQPVARESERGKVLDIWS